VAWAPHSHPRERPPMSLATSRPRSVFGGYPIDAAPASRNSQPNEPEIAMDPVTGTGEIGTPFENNPVAMSGSAATPDKSETQTRVGFIGFGGNLLLARPDDGFIHYRGAGRLLWPRTLCGKTGRRRWRGSGRLCRECDALAGPPDRTPQRPASN
jgi:hypothetical protein